MKNVLRHSRKKRPSRWLLSWVYKGSKAAVLATGFVPFLQYLRAYIYTLELRVLADYGD